jgi:Rod binding domain-containing protein
MDELKASIPTTFAPPETVVQKTAVLGRASARSTAIERKSAAQDFAAFLYLEVLKAMRAAVPKDSLFENDSLSHDIYSSMFDTEIARMLAKRDSEGFSQAVERAIDKIASKQESKILENAPGPDVLSSASAMRQGSNR